MLPVAPVRYKKAKDMADLSKQLLNLQSAYLTDQKATHERMDVEEKERIQKELKDEHTIPRPTVKIALTIPVISKGTVMKNVKESPIWTNFFDSFMKSIDWRSNRYVFTVYVGFDKADDIYDTGDAWSEMREEFQTRAEFRMKEQNMDDIAIHSVLRDTLALKLMHFVGLHGAPSHVVSQLALQAYADGFDYFYQVNDDTIFVTPNWASDFVKILSNNPLVANFGVTGPHDTTNDKIFTHSFVHRTHIDVSNIGIYSMYITLPFPTSATTQYLTGIM